MGDAALLIEKGPQHKTRVVRPCLTLAPPASLSARRAQHADPTLHGETDEMPQPPMMTWPPTSAGEDWSTSRKGKRRAVNRKQQVQPPILRCAVAPPCLSDNPNKMVTMAKADPTRATTVAKVTTAAIRAIQAPIPAAILVRAKMKSAKEATAAGAVATLRSWFLR